MMARPLKEVLTQDRVMLNDIENIQAKILDNEGWRKYIEQQEREQSLKVQFEPVQAPTGRARSKQKESTLTYMDLPYKDWVWMTVLFEDFEQGPDAFWSTMTKFNEAEYETIFLLLETITIKYICRGKMGMGNVVQRKSTLRGKTMKWIRGLIQATGGGVCQAELELMSGLHVSHLSTILGNTHITMLQGRKSQEPANTPRSWRRDEEAILYLPRYLDGTPYRPEKKFERVVDLPVISWENAGLPDDCTAVTETEKNIITLQKWHGTRGKARMEARTKMNVRPEPTPTPVSSMEIPLTTETDSSTELGRTFEFRGERVVLVDDDHRERRPLTNVPVPAATRRVKSSKRHQVNVPAVETDDEWYDENPSKKKTIVWSSPPMTATTSTVTTSTAQSARSSVRPSDRPGTSKETPESGS